MVKRERSMVKNIFGLTSSAAKGSFCEQVGLRVLGHQMWFFFVLFPLFNNCWVWCICLSFCHGKLSNQNWVKWVVGKTWWFSRTCPHFLFLPWIFLVSSLIFRNGRFLLQSSRNILAPSTMSDFEEALNQGSMTAAEVFISLRSKSILHFFASIGSFLGLEVYNYPVSSPDIKRFNACNYVVCIKCFYLLVIHS